MKGGLVYKDFVSEYAPAFTYLIAFILWIGKSDKAVVFVAIVLDGFNLFVWLRLSRAIWPEQTARTILIYYVLSSLAILDVAIAGQNQIWIALLLSTAMLLFMRQTPLLARAV